MRKPDVDMRAKKSRRAAISAAALAALLICLDTFAGNASRAADNPAAVAGADGSTTIYFGPTKPADAKDGNWIQTTPGKGWFTILRL